MYRSRRAATRARTRALSESRSDTDSAADLRFQASTAVAQSLYCRYMILSYRDRDILNLLRDFSLLTSAQVHALAFNSASMTPTKRALKRLRDSRLITRLDFRIVGPHGGEGEFVYKLSPNGLRFCEASASHRDKVGNYAHTLAIPRAFIIFKELERAGRWVIGQGDKGYETEPDCWRTIGGFDLRPDMAITLQTPRGLRQVWLEVDMGSERMPQLRRKLEAFRGAFAAGQVQVFPKTVWITIEAQRATAINALISELEPIQLRDGLAPASALFEVGTFETLADVLTVDK